MPTLLNGMTEINGSVCLIKEHIVNTYNTITDTTGITSYFINTGMRVVIYKNDNELYQINTSDETLCLNITGETMDNWFINYLNALVTTGYTGYTADGITNIENRVIHNNNLYYKLNHIENSIDCVGEASGKWAIIDNETKELWIPDSNNDFFYYETDTCGVKTGRMIVIVMDINPFSLTYCKIQYIERILDEVTLPIIFTTGATLTNPATGVTFSGKVISIGNNTIVSKGFCYGVFSNPTIEDLITTSTGDTTFTSPIVDDLLVDTTYYVRAYVTYYNNNIGNSNESIEYGTEITFIT